MIIHITGVRKSDVVINWSGAPLTETYTTTISPLDKSKTTIEHLHEFLSIIPLMKRISNCKVFCHWDEATPEKYPVPVINATYMVNFIVWMSNLEVPSDIIRHAVSILFESGYCFCLSHDIETPLHTYEICPIPLGTVYLADDVTGEYTRLRHDAAKMNYGELCKMVAIRRNFYDMTLCGIMRRYEMHPSLIEAIIRTYRPMRLRGIHINDYITTFMEISYIHNPNIEALYPEQLWSTLGNFVEEDSYSRLHYFKSIVRDIADRHTFM